MGAFLPFLFTPIAAPISAISSLPLGSISGFSSPSLFLLLLDPWSSRKSARKPGQACETSMQRMHDARQKEKEETKLELWRPVRTLTFLHRLKP
jgi:predicted exporter